MLVRWMVFALLVISIYGDQTSNISCNNAYECQGESISAGNVNSTNYVYCYGYKSCLSAKEIQSKYIHCDSAFDCADVPNINAIGLRCGARSSCLNSIITTNYIDCDGCWSCNESVITARNEIMCSGRESCLGSHIYSPYVIGYSYGALKNSIIEPYGNDLLIQLYGYEAGKYLKIICGKNNKCKLECYGNACHKGIVLCHKDAKCDISPKGCEYKTNGGSIQGISCPYKYSFDDDDNPYIMYNDVDEDYLYDSDTILVADKHATIYIVIGFGVGFVMAVICTFYLKKTKLRAQYETIM